MEVSGNGGTPKSSISRSIFHYNPTIFEDPPFMETHISMMFPWIFQGEMCHFHPFPMDFPMSFQAAKKFTRPFAACGVSPIRGFGGREGP